MLGPDVPRAREKVVSTMRGGGIMDLAASARPVLLSGPDSDPLPWRGTANLAAAQCNAQWRPFKALEKATAVWSPSNEHYERYSGVDLEPEHDPWPVDSMRREQSVEKQKTGDFAMAADAGTLTPGTTGTILVGECTSPGNGGTWHTQRVGPFNSTGGYDWHQISWLDPAFITHAFPDGGGSAGILAHFTGPVDASGKSAIPYPPIHQHHTHIVPNPHDIFLAPLVSWTHDRLMVIHGDWTFETLGVGPVYTAVQAMGQQYTGYQKLINQKPSINLELNDVRTTKSPSMIFYYQISMLVASPDEHKKLRALSIFKTHNIGAMTKGGQSTAVETYANPLDKDSHIWYSSFWPFQSKLVSAWCHMHQTVHQESFLFASTPDDLGIGVPEGSPRNKVMGGSNDALRTRVLQKAEDLDALVCSAKGRLQMVDGYPADTESGACFDRAAYPTCYSKEWKKGEPYTVLTLNGPTADCGQATVHNPRYLPAGTAAQHSIFFLSLEATDPQQAGTSIYSVLFGTSPTGVTTTATQNAFAQLERLMRISLHQAAALTDLVATQAFDAPSAGEKRAFSVSPVFLVTGVGLAAVALAFRTYQRRRQRQPEWPGERTALAGDGPVPC